ncbi:MAG: hypothetical protein ACK4R7_02450 [Fervidobacterium sp.]
MVSGLVTGIIKKSKKEISSFILLFFFLTICLFLEASVVKGEVKFEVIISFGNTPTISLENLPDYSVVIYTSTPNAIVFIDEKYAGVTDSSGRLVVQFSSEGTHLLLVKTSNPFLHYERVYFIVEKKPKAIYITPVGLGKLTIFSNVYPVFITLPNGKGAGVITKSGESVLLPAGSYEIILSSPGYEPVRTQANVPFTKETPLWVEFKPVEFKLELFVQPDKFSPNNDWYNDFCTIKLYSSRNAEGVLQISDFSGKIVYEKQIEVKTGVNEIKWDGAGNKDGAYTVTVLLYDGVKEIRKDATVTIDTSSYTYTKEIFIAFSLLFAGFILYSIFSGN